MSKYIIITIDTEGDDLWNWREGDTITTENVKYIEKFQKLCDEYKFKPVWLTNYEMIMNDDYVKFIKNVVKNNRGELGMHLHAWNSPPEYKLENKLDGQPYLIEYPLDIMEKKIKYLTNLIIERTGIKPISHRAGRWAMNEVYFDLLAKYGYKVDCSVTPGVNWYSCVGATDDSHGSDYTFYSNKPYIVTKKYNNELLEVPMTIRKMRFFNYKKLKTLSSIKNEVLKYKNKKNIWFRPSTDNLTEMKALIDNVKQDDCDYIMFMIHSSELMPNGSPNFKTKEEISKLYSDLRILFNYISNQYEGITLGKYYSLFMEKNNY